MAISESPGFSLMTRPGLKYNLLTPHIFSCFSLYTNTWDNLSTDMVSHAKSMPPPFRMQRRLLHHPGNLVLTILSSVQVSEGLILYQHLDLDTAWASGDSFTFTASSPPAELGPEDFRITISRETNESGRQSRLRANTGTANKPWPVLCL